MALMFLPIPGPLAEEPKGLHPSRAMGRAMLGRVKTWGCQYQNVDPLQIAASPLDLVVIDPVLDGGTGRAAAQQDLRYMQRKPDGSRRLVFAYLSIGAAEEWRSYWNPDWSLHPPDWLGPPNPEWPRSHSARYWHPDWKRIVTDGLLRIVAAGFDGVFLDRVDAYGDWRAENETSLDDMADFVVQLAQATRTLRPGFLLIGQNAEPLLMLPQYRDFIDAVSKESLLTGLQGENTSNRPDQIEWSLKYLVRAQEAGLPILTIEYLAEQADISAAILHHRSLGLVPFIGSRLLDRLP